MGCLTIKTDLDQGHQTRQRSLNIKFKNLEVVVVVPDAVVIVVARVKRAKVIPVRAPALVRLVTTAKMPE